MAALDIDAKARDLLLEAVSLWEGEDWYRYNDAEPNCTIRLYESMQRVKEANRGGRYWWIRVQLESVAPTPDMLAGDDDASGMPRPDLRMTIGRAEKLVECKRLSPGEHVRLYVDRGLARFVDTYYASQHARGMMVGFIQAGTPDDLSDEINVRIDHHSDMGPDHRLVALAVQGNKPPKCLHEYLSQHDVAGRSTIGVEHHHMVLGQLHAE